MLRLQIRFAATMAALAMISGCSGDDNGSAAPPNNDASVTDATTFDSSTTVDSSSDANSDAAVLTDGEILAIMMAANTGEISEAQLVPSRSTNADVQAFATRMITDHTSMNATLSQIETQESLTPEPSSIQAQLQTSAEQTIATLQPLTGATFDVSYVQSQVTAHTQVLALLNQTLIPSAQDAALKTALQSAATTVAMHLQMAQALASELAEGGTSMDGGADGSDAM